VGHRVRKANEFKFEVLKKKVLADDDLEKEKKEKKKRNEKKINFVGENGDCIPNCTKLQRKKVLEDDGPGDIAVT